MACSLMDTLIEDILTYTGRASGKNFNVRLAKPKASGVRWLLFLWLPSPRLYAGIQNNLIPQKRAHVNSVV